MNPGPITLVGDVVTLVPLEESHVDELADVGLDPRIWEVSPRTMTSRADLAAYVQEAVSQGAAGKAVPFAIVLKEDGRAIGSTRYGNIDRTNRRLEIGWTWIAPDWWRTAVNTECKLLLLSHAFEDLGCVRVELKTDVLNARSRAAIIRLGAKEEGVLRKHVLTAGGRWRDTVYYSILDDEWPDVKSKLLAP